MNQIFFIWFMNNRLSSFSSQHYHCLISTIGQILQEGRRRALQSVNQILVQTYWEIGRQIVEFEQQGKETAEYGSALLDTLSRDLKLRFGKGFGKSNIYLMRQFYLKYQKFRTVSGKLSWSHYSEILTLEDDLARQFYEKQLHDGWSVRELQRQIKTALFHRVALSKDKKEVLKLARKGQVIEKESDVLKEPYIFEFLKIPEGAMYSEKNFEQSLIDNLQMFLLELGKGFAFVGRQYRITFFFEIPFFPIR